MFDDAVGVEKFQIFMGIAVNEFIDVLPLPFHSINKITFFDRLIRTCRVDPVGRLSVQPVVRAAEAGAFGRDDADMVGSERLTQSAGIERVHRLIGQVRYARVTLQVDLAGRIDQLKDLFFARVYFNLDFIEDIPELSM